MKNLKTPNPFILIRQNTQPSDINSQMSYSINLPTKKQQDEHQTTILLGKTLKYLNKNHDFMNFKNRIIIPKIKRIDFIQTQQLKKQNQRATRLLLGGVKLLQATPRKIKNQDHSIYDDPPLEERKVNRFLSNPKPRKRQGLSHLYNTQSLSKIQQLTNKEKQQPIAEHNYENKNYIFMNLNKMGQSQQISVFQLEELHSKIDRTQVMSPLRKDSNVSFNTRPIRIKVKSLTKYDRQRHRSQQSQQQKKQFHLNQTKRTLQKMRDQRSQSQLMSSQVIKLISIQTPSHNTFQNKKKNATPFSSFKNFVGMRNQSQSKIMQNSLFSLADEQKFNIQIQQISKNYHEINKQQDSLCTLLAAISKDTNKDTIRIYKDDFQKIYTYRYGRDRISAFFDYQYIEDYASLRSIFTESILNFKKQEILLLSFLMLDFDNDGLISHSDLFKLLTRMDKNTLVKQNIYTLLKYVKQNFQNGGINDVCNQEYIKKDNLTLKKYRFMVYMKQKKKTQDSSIMLSPKKSPGRKIYASQSLVRQTSKPLKDKSPNGSLQTQLFSLRPDTTQIKKQFQILKAFLDSIAGNNQPIINGLYSFKMNFQRFKSIYASKIPQIYYDFLYTGFGLKNSKFQYESLDHQTPLLKPRKITYLQEISKYEVLQYNLEEMRQTRVDLNQKQFKVDIKRNKRIKSVLD